MASFLLMGILALSIVSHAYADKNEDKDNNGKHYGQYSNTSDKPNKDNDDKEKNDNEKGRTQQRLETSDSPSPFLDDFELNLEGKALTKNQDEGGDISDASAKLQGTPERKDGNLVRFSIEGSVKLENGQDYKINEGKGSILYFRNMAGNSIIGLIHISGKAVSHDGSTDSGKFRLRAIVFGEDHEVFKVIVIPAAKIGPHITLLSMEGKMTMSNSNTPPPTNDKLDHFVISTIPSPIAAGSLFNVTATAYTSNGIVLKTYEAKAKITDLTNTVYPTTLKFSNGVFKGTLNITETVASDKLTITQDDKKGTSNNFAVFAGPLAKIDLTPSSATIAPAEKVTFTARGFDKFGNELSGLAFSWSVSSSDLGSISTSGDKANFTASSLVTSPSNVILTASIGIRSDSSKVVITPAPTRVLDHFEINNISSPKIAGSTFSITIRAVELTGNTVTGYTGPMKLRDTTGSLNMTVASNEFINGVWTGNVNITKSAQNVKITASDVSLSNKKGTSNEFDIKPAAVTKVLVLPKSGIAKPGGHVELNATSATMSIGSKVTLVAEAFDRFNNKIIVDGPSSATSFVWSLNPVSLGNLDLDATTNSVEFTALASGSGTIRATFSSVSGSVITLTVTQ